MRPKPDPNADTSAYWEAARRGELLLQRCRQCRRYQFYPRSHCRYCGGEPAWERALGRGTVYSYTLVQRPAGPGFEAPYVVALVDLEEGPRMMTNIVDCPPATVCIGMSVAITFQTVEDGFVLPQFRPLPSTT